MPREWRLVEKKKKQTNTFAILTEETKRLSREKYLNGNNCSVYALSVAIYYDLFAVYIDDWLENIYIFVIFVFVLALESHQIAATQALIGKYKRLESSWLCAIFADYCRFQISFKSNGISDMFKRKKKKKGSRSPFEMYEEGTRKKKLDKNTYAKRFEYVAINNEQGTVIILNERTHHWSALRLQ